MPYLKHRKMGSVVIQPAEYTKSASVIGNSGSSQCSLTLLCSFCCFLQLLKYASDVLQKCTLLNKEYNVIYGQHLEHNCKQHKVAASNAITELYLVKCTIQLPMPAAKTSP